MSFQVMPWKGHSDSGLKESEKVAPDII